MIIAEDHQCTCNRHQVPEKSFYEERIEELGYDVLYSELNNSPLIYHLSFWNKAKNDQVANFVPGHISCWFPYVINFVV